MRSNKDRRGAKTAGKEAGFAAAQALLQKKAGETRRRALPGQPPRAAKKEFIHEKFGDSRLDPYFWMREKDSPEVLAYLEAENRYAKEALKGTETLQKELFQEMKSRIPGRFDSEPAPDGPYLYLISWEEGREYPIHKRRKREAKKSQADQDEVILDQNLLAKSRKYCDVGGLEISPSHKILAYSLDSKGREIYDIYFKNLETGKLLPKFVSQAVSDFVWANDNQTIFYTKQDPVTLRPFQVWRFHTLTGESQIVFEEKDTRFSVFLKKSLSNEALIIVSASSLTSECRYLFADDPKGEWTLFAPREPGHEYNIDYGGGCFYICSNKDSAFNFKLMKCPRQEAQETGQSAWREMIPHREDVYIEDLEVFQDFIALEVRKKGRREVEIWDRKTEKSHSVEFPETVYACALGENREYKTDLLRLELRSFTKPKKVYDYQFGERNLHFKRQAPAGKSFRPENYAARQEFVRARAGAEIPLSLVFKKGLKFSPSTPFLLYGYGSYGFSQDPGFQAPVFSLIDRGFVYAVAHIRGGAEKGRKWYEGGKFLKKKNTFTDFIDCAESLVQKSWTSPEHLYIMGGSAGGLLMGAVLNESPELFRGAAAVVPFVDVLTTILDESLPLSAQEHEEWGDPNKKEFYDYIKTYSPYDNVKKAVFPHLLIEAGYHDPRVSYWEPAKWTARLRDCKTDENLLLLLTDMGSGHFGETGRFQNLRRIARRYAFFLSLESKAWENLE